MFDIWVYNITPFWERVCFIKSGVSSLSVLGMLPLFLAEKLTLSQPGERKIIPTKQYGHPRIFKPSYGPDTYIIILHRICVLISKLFFLINKLKRNPISESGIFVYGTHFLLSYSLSKWSKYPNSIREILAMCQKIFN